MGWPAVVKTWVEVESATEGRELRRGLADPTVRQFVRIVSALAPHDMRPASLCGPRCFLEFLDALMHVNPPAAPGPDPTDPPGDDDDPERSNS